MEDPSVGLSVRPHFLVMRYLKKLSTYRLQTSYTHIDFGVKRSKVKVIMINSATLCCNVTTCTKISLWKCYGILKDKMINPQEYLLDL